jgi:hypothetical protein
MTSFWVEAQRRILQEKALAEEAKKKNDDVPVPVPESAKPAPKAAAAAVASTVKAPPPEEEEEEEYEEDDDTPVRQRGSRRTARLKRTPRRTAQVKRKRKKNEDLDDETVVTVGNQLSDIKGLDKVYPLFGRKTKRVVQQGVKRIMDGTYKDWLYPNERKLVKRNKDKFETVTTKKKNPFDKKRKVVGDVYSRFMKEAYMENHSSTEYSSDSDDSTSSSD